MLALLVGLLFATNSSATPEILKVTITSPKHLPDYVQIEATPLDDGLIKFAVRLHKEKAAHVDHDTLYRGRVSVTALLELANATEGKLARTSIEADRDVYGVHQGDPVLTIAKPDRESSSKEVEPLTTFRFEIQKDLAAHSKLYINTSLHEKDGHPTLGGGIHYEIALAGFISADAATSPKSISLQGEWLEIVDETPRHGKWLQPDPITLEVSASVLTEKHASKVIRQSLFLLAEGAESSAIDFITVVSGEFWHTKAIYKLESDELTICEAAKGEARPTEFRQPETAIEQFVLCRKFRRVTAEVKAK